MSITPMPVARRYACAAYWRNCEHEARTHRPPKQLDQFDRQQVRDWVCSLSRRAVAEILIHDMNHNGPLHRRAIDSWR